MSYHLTTNSINLPLLPIVIVALITYGCSESEEELNIFVNCVNQIEHGYQSSLNCRKRVAEICTNISKEPSFVFKSRLFVVKAKGIASDLLSFVGVTIEGFNYSECMVVEEDTCRDLVALWHPCKYESCRIEIPEKCAEFKFAHP